jgi:hypothetical protein
MFSFACCVSDLLLTDQQIPSNTSCTIILIKFISDALNYGHSSDILGILIFMAEGAQIGHASCLARLNASRLPFQKIRV